MDAIDADSLASARRASSTGSSEAPPSVERTELTVPGEPDVRVRVHRPVDATAELACVVSLHSGGYIMGDAAWEDRLFDEWCPRLSIVGISIAYRLAPETPYPGPLMDCYAALKWIHDNAESLGVDKDRIGLHGMGAGGGLAAALALVARDHREVPVTFQVLDGAMLDDRQQTHTSRLDGLPGWTPETVEFSWRSYLGDLYGSPEPPIYAAAARCARLRRLPPTYIAVGALDRVHDENVDFATRLNHAGIPTELHVYPGASEGYRQIMPDEIAARVSKDKADWIAGQLGAQHPSRHPNGGSRPTRTPSDRRH